MKGPAAKATVLVVDDEASIQDLVLRFLKKRGYTLLSATTAEEALQSFTDNHVDLVILDIELENSHGLDLVEPFKTQRPDIPIVIFTGRGFDESILQKAREMGVIGYASKTLPFDQLLMEIKRALRKTAG